MRVSIHKDNAAISRELSLVISNIARESIANRGRFVTAWSGGSLPSIACADLVSPETSFIFPFLIFVI